MFFYICMYASYQKAIQWKPSLGCLESAESAKAGTKCMEVDRLLEDRSP